MPVVTAAAGEIWEVVLMSRLENQDHLNVLHFHVDTAVDDIQLRLLKAIVDCFLLNMIPGLSTQFHCIGARGHRVSPTIGPEVEYYHTNTSVASTGLASGDGLPSYSSCCISIHTTAGGKSGRGRFFIGGVPEGSTQFSFLTTEGAFWVALLTFLTCVVTTFIHTGDPGSNQLTLGVLSRKDHTPGTPFPADKFAGATNLVPHQLLSTTKSRKVGRGS